MATRNSLGRRGFTLTEMLVVISVLMLIMSLTLPSVQAARETASRIQCINHLKQIGLAIHQYAVDHGSFPLDNDQPIAKFTFTVLGDVGVDPFADPLPAEFYYPMGGADPINNVPFYAAILPYMEETSQMGTWHTDPQPVKAYRCPSRLHTGEPKNDFGGVIHPSFFVSAPGQVIHGAQDYKITTTCGGQDEVIFGRVKIIEGEDGELIVPDVQEYIDRGWEYLGTVYYDPPYEEVAPASPFASFSLSPNWQGKYAILGGFFFDALPVEHVTNADGCSNTLLLAHKGRDPHKPNGGNDEGWGHIGNYKEHKRSFEMFGRDIDHVQRAGKVLYAEDLNLSPHPFKMPSLLGDGSVRCFGLNMNAETLLKLWAYNDGEIITEQETPEAGPMLGPDEVTPADGTMWCS